MKVYPEKVLMAAIKFKSLADGEEIVVTGVRHYSPDMRAIIDKIGGPSGGRRWLEELEQGFMTNQYRFVSREEAMQIVLENGQEFDLERNGGSTKELFSEGIH